MIRDNSVLETVLSLFVRMIYLIVLLTLVGWLMIYANFLMQQLLFPKCQCRHDNVEHISEVNFLALVKFHLLIYATRHMRSVLKVCLILRLFAVVVDVVA